MWSSSVGHSSPSSSSASPIPTIPVHPPPLPPLPDTTTTKIASTSVAERKEEKVEWAQEKGKKGSRGKDPAGTATKKVGAGRVGETSSPSTYYYSQTSIYGSANVNFHLFFKKIISTSIQCKDCLNTVNHSTLTFPHRHNCTKWKESTVTFLFFPPPLPLLSHFILLIFPLIALSFPLLPNLGFF